MHCLRAALVVVFILNGCGEDSGPSTPTSTDRMIPMDGSVEAGVVTLDATPNVSDVMATEPSIVDASATPDLWGGQDAELGGLMTVPDAAALDGTADLELLREELMDDVWLDERMITEDSCVLLEGCVSGTGLRRLLRFSVATANIGTADLFMGRPQANESLFEYSSCHEHWHFASYANYQLSRDGEEVAIGHKQAFCLMDTDRHNMDDPTVNEQARYSCGFQGISRGWQDTYGSHLDCQWVDVTDLEPGEYELSVQINDLRILEELSYENNDHTVPVTVTDGNILAACPIDSRTGIRRSCGWVMGDTHRCRTGELIEIGCGGCNDLGAACEGDPMLRVCEGEGKQCLPSMALAQNNNGCGETKCPHVEFMCPDTRVFTIWTAAHDNAEPATCVPSVRAGPPQITRPCGEMTPEGLERTCGWTVALDNVECRPGLPHRVGCSPGDEACHVGGRCLGDPMMRVCEGNTPCLSPNALLQSDDACGGSCPAGEFECPLQGRVSVFVAPYRFGVDSVCEPSIRVIE